MKPEEREQCALIEWASLDDDIWPYLIHIRNEGKRSLAEGARAKRMGLMKGVSDLFFAHATYGMKDSLSGNPLPFYFGMWIELKSLKGQLTQAQIDFQKKMFGRGYFAHTYYSWTDAANAILEYLGKPKQF